MEIVIKLLEERKQFIENELAYVKVITNPNSFAIATKKEFKEELLQINKALTILRK